MSPSVPVIRRGILPSHLWLVDAHHEIFGNDPWWLEDDNLPMQSQEPAASTDSDTNGAESMGGESSDSE